MGLEVELGADFFAAGGGHFGGDGLVGGGEGVVWVVVAAIFWFWVASGDVDGSGVANFSGLDFGVKF